MVLVHVLVKHPTSAGGVAPLLREEGIADPMRLSKFGQDSYQIVTDGKGHNVDALEVG